MRERGSKRIPTAAAAPAQKRILDFVASAIGLVVLSPLMALIAVLIVLDDGGPVLFAQERTGRGDRTFRMLKFRTMRRDSRGAPLTVGRDPRITRAGHWLRSTKLDELPQLLNVLRGDMSLVGPRPEVPRYTRLYSPAQRRVLDLTPGITDPASIRYRDEASELAAFPDPERAYIEIVMPDKIRMNLEYAEHATVRSDVGVILRTLLPARRVRSPGSRPGQEGRA